MSQHRPWVGYLLAAIGVMGLLAEGGLHFLSFFLERQYELNHGVLLISMIIGFVGFYIIDPVRAKDGTGILRETAVAVIGVVRSGRRATDADVVVVAPVDIPPVAPTTDTDERGDL